MRCFRSAVSLPACRVKTLQPNTAQPNPPPQGERCLGPLPGHAMPSQSTSGPLQSRVASFATFPPSLILLFLVLIGFSLATIDTGIDIRRTQHYLTAPSNAFWVERSSVLLFESHLIGFDFFCHFQPRMHCFGCEEVRSCGSGPLLVANWTELRSAAGLS